MSRTEPIQGEVAFATTGLFPMLGVGPMLGRSFSEIEARESADVAMVSAGFWRRVLDGSSAAIGAGRFAVERGLALNADDRLRRDAIMALMCQGRLDFASLEQAHAIAETLSWRTRSSRQKRTRAWFATSRSSR